MGEWMMIIGGIYGALAVVFGAFGAHFLRKHLSDAQLRSFETGVKYQMYHALLLLCIGHIIPFDQVLQELMAWCIVLGVSFFSFSIYGLVLTSARGRKYVFLGPITPLGGFLLIAGWTLFILNMVLYV